MTINYKIPEYTREGLIKYCREGIKPGSFLTAVLENDLMRATAQADKENREAIFEICKFVYNELPSACWGSREKVRNWIEIKRKEKHENALD